MKKVTDLKENEAIHCQTKAEAKEICKLMHDAGLEWNTGEGYNEDNCWNIYREKTCYCPYEGIFGNTEQYTKINYIIHKASDFINQAPKRGDKVLVWDDFEEYKRERIFLTKIKGSIYPYIVVTPLTEDEFKSGDDFDSMDFKNMKTMPKVKTTPKKNKIELIKKWFIDRNLNNGEPTKQMLKLYEEIGEISAALARDNEEEIKDGIGDAVVVLIGLSMQLGLDFEECIEIAYNEIKDRKGKLVNGVFVKEGDLK